MISRHTEIGVLNEDKGWSMRRLLGKAIVGNKRCIPNQIEIKKRGRLYVRLWKKMGLAKEYQSSQFCIEEYLTLPHIKLIGIIRDGNDGISSGMRRLKLRSPASTWATGMLNFAAASAPARVEFVSP